MMKEELKCWVARNLRMSRPKSCYNADNQHDSAFSQHCLEVLSTHLCCVTSAGSLYYLIKTTG
jgi:hypothetical protein